MSRKAVRELENVLIGLQGGIALYRRGISEHLVPHGFDIAREKLAAAKRSLVAFGMFERCRHAIDRAEELVKLGPENDEAAEMLILTVNRDLMGASGTHAHMSALAKKPGVTLDDFKPDPDQWEIDDREGRDR